MSRAHLARQLTAAITQAACKGQSRWWTECENAHAAAATPAQAQAAAAPALAVCAGCPEVTRCVARAELDDYTGLAAGTAWVNGVRRAEYTTKTITVTLDRPDSPRVARAMRLLRGRRGGGHILSLIHISEPTRPY